ncbi:MAG: hypothetical protein Q8O88_05090 [bacterium]|nr:hypothetical protein [bacterium]
MTIRKKIRLATYYLLPIILLLVYLITPSTYDIFPFYGRVAIFTLAIIMFVKPLAVFIKNPIYSTLLGYRRELGHACIWFFLFHMTGMLFTRNLFHISYFLNTSSFLFWAGLSAIGMFILILTSNDFAIRTLRKNWKRLQQVSYFVLFFALIHVSLIRTGSFLTAFLIITFYLILKYFEYKKLHKKIDQ